MHDFTVCGLLEFIIKSKVAIYINVNNSYLYGIFLQISLIY